MNYAEESLRLHEAWGGKIEVTARVPVATRDDLSLAYTPGVAQPAWKSKGRQPVLRPDPAAQPLRRRHRRLRRPGPGRHRARRPVCR